MTTATDLRAEAAAAHQRSADSFDRCDTDGFLSQWALDLTGRKLSAEADLLDAGGLVEVPALFDLDGNVASTHLHHGQYGYSWVLDDAHANAAGRRFINRPTALKSARRRATLRGKGFTEGTVSVRGYVTITGSGTGLSGCASARVATLPVVDDLKAGLFTVVATDDDTTDY
jgi:hypothetical protein